MNVLFVNDSTSNANWGDRAAAISLKHMVTQSGGIISRAISEDDLGNSSFLREAPSGAVEQQVESGGGRETLKLFIPPLFLKMRQKIIAHAKPPVQEASVPRRWEDFEPCLSRVLSDRSLHAGLLTAVEQSDLLVIHGDGCMTGCDHLARAELFLTYLAKKCFGRSVIMVNHTADFSDPVLKRIAENIYPLFDDVVYRDPISVERNRELCSGRFAPDSAFTFKPMSGPEWVAVAQRPTYFDVWPDTALFDPAMPYLCIGGSSIYYYHQHYDAGRGFAGLIERIGNMYRGQIVLTVSDLRDQEIFRPLARRYNLPLIGLTTPVQQAVDIIGNAQAYIGGRWHPSIFALRGGVPVISLSSLTFKTQAFSAMTKVGTGAFNALSLEDEEEAICRQLAEYLERGGELRSSLRSWAEKEAERSWDNITYLRKMSGDMR